MSFFLHLEDIYGRFNKREFVHPDPLEFLYGYPSTEDREIAGMIASSLAYGRVAQILKSVSLVLEAMGPHPRKFLLEGDAEKWHQAFGGFKHRFTDSRDLINLLWGMRGVLRKYGSLDGAMARSVGGGGDFSSRVKGFAEMILDEAGGGQNSLLPDPGRGSACKRLMLYLRWMVRRDDVDPGGWTSLRPSDLVVPLDTHMHRISLGLGLTDRKSADFKTALQITDAFRALSPDDPVKYDFALTRFGIRADMEIEDLLKVN